MDYKQQAAEAATALIREHMRIGFGAGATMAHMVAYLAAMKRKVDVYSSSGTTRKLLIQQGYQPKDITGVHALDLYFDGCDQFDQDLNALKSGAGIHTLEKLLASMATEFILVGDDSKYATQLTNRYPVVLEVLPMAKTFVRFTLHQLYPDAIITARNTVAGSELRTENGHCLLDIFFMEMPAASLLDRQLNDITGVVESSLFYNLASKAIIANAQGITIFQKKQLS